MIKYITILLFICSLTYGQMTLSDKSDEELFGMGGVVYAESFPYNKFLFIGNYSAISGGKMPNILDTTTLIVAGSTGSETYKLRDNTINVNADTSENLWFSSLGVQSVVQSADLVYYDFNRTFVDFDYSYPYGITKIGILKSDAVLTASDSTAIQNYFDLSVWWSGKLSVYGEVKANRPFSKVVYEKFESGCTEYEAMLAVFPTEPSNSDKIIQNKMIKALVDSGYFAKAEVLNIYATPTADASLFNWKNPEANNPTAVGGIVWTQYDGYQGASGKYINMNYNPTAHGGERVGQDNLCIMIGCQTDGVTSAAIGSGVSGYVGSINLAPQNTATRPLVQINSATSYSPVVIGGKGHWYMSRDNANNFNYGKNSTSAIRAVASDGLINNSIHACGSRFNTNNSASTAKLSYAFVFSSLTDAELKAIVVIMEEYLDNYNTGLY